MTRLKALTKRIAPFAPAWAWASIACWFLGTAAAPAFTLEFPGPATPTFGPTTTRDSYAMPTSAWSPQAFSTQSIDGMVERAAWQVDTPKLSSLDLMQPLRAQLLDAGFKPVFECETMVCGGFDFRFAIDVLPEPQMHVDLGDFRFLSAERQVAGETEAVGVIVSRSANKGFVQVTRAMADAGPPLFAATNGMGEGFEPLTGETVNLTAPNQPPLIPPADGASDGLQFVTKGSLVLDGLDFGSGAADLTEGRYASLAALAEWLKDNPNKIIALVGHTDTSGGLDSNLLISKRRAASVRARLIEAYGIPPSQIEAQGVGYLSPIASNLTEEGRRINRRVEAVLTSVQ
ncbi:OmpA family protein [Pseudorhodobacter sp. W20_MBD10_FR17]|uniref:OmpA family protein n=1 Tax=Pseudorhodobacter sp. W20_MBD10_FR17 TaxID=3240266 RepID=UPI003F95C811